MRQPSFTAARLVEDKSSANAAGLHPVLAAALAGGLTACAAVLGAKTAPDRWYRKLVKPAFQPADAVFAPVWTGLYAMIATSGFRVMRAPASRARSRALQSWGTQLALNAAWSPLFFGLHRPRAALLDLGLLLASAGRYVSQAGRVDKAAARLMLPYLGWSAFAFALNTEILRLNPRR